MTILNVGVVFQSGFDLGFVDSLQLYRTKVFSFPKRKISFWELVLFFFYSSSNLPPPFFSMSSLRDCQYQMNTSVNVRFSASTDFLSRAKVNRRKYKQKRLLHSFSSARFTVVQMFQLNKEPTKILNKCYFSLSS